MTALAMAAALAAALLIGFLIGRRTASRPPSWRRRTSRGALGRQAIGLVTLIAASQVQRAVRRRVPMVAAQRLPWPIRALTHPR